MLTRKNYSYRWQLTWDLGGWCDRLRGVDCSRRHGVHTLWIQQPGEAHAPDDAEIRLRVLSGIWRAVKTNHALTSSCANGRPRLRCQLFALSCPRNFKVNCSLHIWQKITEAMNGTGNWYKLSIFNTIIKIV